MMNDVIGKTTLLNTLSFRYNPQKLQVSGQITLNGKEYNRNDLKAMSGYVMQVRGINWGLCF